MNAITFDSLKYSRQLEQAGFSREQAEGQALVQQETLTQVMSDVASKSEVASLKSDTNNYKNDISTLKTDVAILKIEIAVLKWMVGTVGFGVLMLLVKAFI